MFTKVLALLVRLPDALWVSRRRKMKKLLPEETQRDIDYYNSNGPL